MADQDPVADFLMKTPTTKAQRADLWDAYHKASSDSDLATVLQSVDAPATVKAALFDYKQKGTFPTLTPRTDDSALAKFWQAHPSLKAMATNAVNTLPGIGAIAGSAMATPETLGIGTVAGAALGAGVGRGVRDLVTEGTGLEPESTQLEKGARIAMDVGLAAVTPGVIEGAKTPFKTVAEFIEWAKQAIPTPLQPKLLSGLSQVLRNADTLGLPKTNSPLLTRPSWQLAEPGAEVATSSAPKMKLTAFDVIRARSLMQRGMSEADALKSVLLSKSSAFAGLPTDSEVAATVAAKNAR